MAAAGALAPASGTVASSVLTDEPLVVETTNAAGEPTLGNIDGYTFANLIVQQSYIGESGFASVPSMIHDVANGDGRAAAASLLSQVAPPGLVGYGLAFGAYCREMTALTTPEEVAATARAALPDFPAEVRQFVPVAGRVLANCAIGTPASLPRTSSGRCAATCRRSSWAAPSTW